MNKMLAAAIAGFIFTSIFLVACKKNDNSGPQPDGHVLLVNASPGDTVAYDFYFNDTKLNTQPLNYPSNSGYLALKPANYTVKIAAINTINPIANGSVGVGSAAYYSVFAYDTLLSGKIKTFAIQDDLTAPAAGKSKVRFLHLSPVNLAVDILANDSVIFANRSYADNVANNSKSAFASINAGVYTIKVKLAGSGEGIPSILTLNNISLSAGSVYTIFAKGKVNGTGVNALGVEIITNK